MKNQLLIVQNISRETPGYFLDRLKAWSVPHFIVDLSRGEQFPDLSDYRALVVFGGPDSANDSSPKIRSELEHIARVVENEMPYLGICLGMQLLVKTTGGSVVPCPVKEIGFRNEQGTWFRISLTEAGRNDPLFRGISSPFPIFHLHGETVVPSHSTVLLGTSPDCPMQIVRVGKNAYGFQGHLELTESLLKRWLQEDPDLQRLSPTRVVNDFHFLLADYRNTAETIFRNFLTISGFLSG